MSDASRDRAATLTGGLPDLIYGDGGPPVADARVEYMAGGSASFPLASQVLLSKSFDDLTRDLGDEVYETMLLDPTVWGAVLALFTGVLNGAPQVLPRVRPEPGENPPPGSERARECALSAEVAAFWRRQLLRQGRSFEETAFEFLMGACFGTKLAEKVFEDGEGEDAGRIVLRRLRFKRHRSWYFLVDPYGNVVAIRGLEVGGPPVDLPPQKCMVFTWMARDGDPRGRSLLRAAYNGWNLKINSWPKLYKYLDRFGTPIVVGTAAADAPPQPELDASNRPTGRQLTGTEALGQQLARLEGGAWIAIRQGSEIAIYQPTGNGEAFLHSVDIFKHEILEGILTTARALLEAEHGSKVDTEAAHDYLLARLIGMLRKGVSQTYERQLFHHGTELNWGRGVADRHTPELAMGDVEPKDVAKVVDSFTRAGWRPTSDHLPYIDARAGLPIRRHGTPSIPPATAQAGTPDAAPPPKAPS
jgi:hypothetical protein